MQLVNLFCLHSKKSSANFARGTGDQISTITCKNTYYSVSHIPIDGSLKATVALIFSNLKKTSSHCVRRSYVNCLMPLVLYGIGPNS